MIRGILESARGIRAADQSERGPRRADDPQPRRAQRARVRGASIGIEKRQGQARRHRPQRHQGRASAPTMPNTLGVMGSVPQPPQQGQFTASGPQLADNGMGQSGAPSSGSAPVLGTLRGTAMIPRDYQRAAVDAARDRTAAHGNTMLVLPTGAGKTAIAGFYIGEELEATADTTAFWCCSTPTS